MLSEAEVNAIIADPNKEIAGDIVWRSARPNDAAQSFDVRLYHASAAEVHVHGWFNPTNQKLSFSLIAQRQRLYGLDMVGRHKNQSGETFRGMHKQRWSDEAGCAEAFIPDDITAPRSEPRLVW